MSHDFIIGYCNAVLCLIQLVNITFKIYLLVFIYLFKSITAAVIYKHFFSTSCSV